uniref:Uncharacterized protein n=1 Tax=Nicotiana tabacum TaxID=4097 RepID=A0A1S4BS21_TOBAC|nr:PREDICTED: uncharacterized protein LOC107811302 [Nicotiana tabacum]
MANPGFRQRSRSTYCAVCGEGSAAALHFCAVHGRVIQRGGKIRLQPKISKNLPHFPLISSLFFPSHQSLFSLPPSCRRHPIVTAENRPPRWPTSNPPQNFTTSSAQPPLHESKPQNPITLLNLRRSKLKRHLSHRPPPTNSENFTPPDSSSPPLSIYPTQNPKKPIHRRHLPLLLPVRHPSAATASRFSFQTGLGQGCVTFQTGLEQGCVIDLVETGLRFIGIFGFKNINNRSLPEVVPLPIIISGMLEYVVIL